MRIFIYGLVHPNDPLDYEHVVYVGKANDVLKRVKSHVNAIGHRKRHLDFQRWLIELKKAGLWPNALVLEECDSGEWGERETYWIEKLKGTIFNVQRGGAGMLTMKESTKRKLGRASSGRSKGKKMTEEQKQRMRDGIAHSSLRKKRSLTPPPKKTDEEKKEARRLWIQRISDAQKRRLKSVGQWNKGMTFSEEQKNAFRKNGWSENQFSK